MKPRCEGGLGAFSQSLDSILSPAARGAKDIQFDIGRRYGYRIISNTQPNARYSSIPCAGRYNGMRRLLQDRNPQQV
jgi:hypothetical protein